MSDAIKSLIKAQSEMGKAIKGSLNPHFKSRYADLEAVVNATMAAFHANGFAVLQPNDQDAGGHYVETRLLHTSGAEFCSRVYLVLGKNDMQGLGSAITYARRYGLLGMAGIAPEDDDGNAAVANKKGPAIELTTEARVDAAVEFYSNCSSEAFNKYEKGFHNLLSKVETADQHDRLFDAHNNRFKQLFEIEENGYKAVGVK
tara:strand:+ start:1900 stop:2505 length:606 start_codon:yes stop_codon:yes gene_type:complete